MKEQIQEVLWTDTTDPERLSLRFKNEIYRLRHILGQDILLFQDNRYQLNPAIHFSAL